VTITLTLRVGGTLLKLVRFLGISLGLAIGSNLSAGLLPFNQLIIFGDSLSDNGNDFIATGGALPAPPAYTAGRFTNGPDVTPTTAFTGVWHEQLAALLSLPVAQPSLTGGTNWAFGGADTTAGFSPLGVPGLGIQVATFLGAQPNPSPTALYVLEGGANDLLDAAEAPGATAASVAAAEVLAIQNLTSQIAGLAMSGAKDFLWFDVGPLDLAPETQGSPLKAALGSASLQFRSDVLAAVGPLQSTYGIQIAVVDLYSSYILWRSNPATFGLTNVNDPASFVGAPNPDTYLNWDGLHPTTKGHDLIAQTTIDSIDATFAPEPSTAWLVCLVAVPFGFRLLIWKSIRNVSRF
jgi:phospholipase/lecithinase/hemolysin